MSRPRQIDDATHHMLNAKDSIFEGDLPSRRALANSRLRRGTNFSTNLWFRNTLNGSSTNGEGYLLTANFESTGGGRATIGGQCESCLLRIEKQDFPVDLRTANDG